MFKNDVATRAERKEQNMMCALWCKTTLWYDCQAENTVHDSARPRWRPMFNVCCCESSWTVLTSHWRQQNCFPFQICRIHKIFDSKTFTTVYNWMISFMGETSCSRREENYKFGSKNSFTQRRIKLPYPTKLPKTKATTTQPLALLLLLSTSSLAHNREAFVSTFWSITHQLQDPKSRHSNSLSFFDIGKSITFQRALKSLERDPDNLA